MKKYMCAWLIAASCLVFGVEGDCGLNDLFEKLSDRIYCEAECSGSPDKINQLLKEADARFSEKLDCCTLSEDQIEPTMHKIARSGTPKMLQRFAKEEHFKGYDNIDEGVGGTPLMTAAMYGNIDLVQELLNQGADPAKEVSFEVNGNKKTMTPELAALKIPAGYAAGGLGVMAVLPIIISRSARYADFSYDPKSIEKMGPMLAPLAPFVTCLELIIAAKKKQEDEAAAQQGAQANE